MNLQDSFNLFLHNPKEPLLFHTGFFLFIFSIFLIIYSFISQKRDIRSLCIILFSIYFYYKASGFFIVLLLFTVSMDYLFSVLIHHQEKPLLRKLVLILSIAFSLSFLLYFKYRDFFMSEFYNLKGGHFTTASQILPVVGISFYTFQSISYLVDIYTRKIERPSYPDYLMYMTFFPHLVAGPIVRARDFIPQLKSGISITKPILSEALYLITKGLIKKAIIADFISQYPDIVFSAPGGFSGTEHILSTLCYTLQIFCDFSGYTDMAIGVALLLGYRLSLNFDSPYKARNITNFWRRWHISLSSWLRDYIYIPMGGNRNGMIMQLFFLFATMLIGGFWHGANTKFILWGGVHGLLLIIHKLFVSSFSERMSGWWFIIPSWLITFACVALLWVPFRAKSIDDTWVIYTKIFTTADPGILKDLFQVNMLLFILIFLGYFLTVLPSSLKTKVRKKYYEQDFFAKIFFLVIIIQVIIQLRSATVQPFIYFQF
jgi:alginate O-acetyltransferase complex protein AlgI